MDSTRVYKYWTTEATKTLILYRRLLNEKFTGRRGSAAAGWAEICEAVNSHHADLKVDHLNCKRKWDNLLTKYKDLKLQNENDSGSEHSEKSEEWPFYNLLDKFLGCEYEITPISDYISHYATPVYGQSDTTHGQALSMQTPDSIKHVFKKTVIKVEEPPNTTCSTNVDLVPDKQEDFKKNRKKHKRMKLVARSVATQTLVPYPDEYIKQARHRLRMGDISPSSDVKSDAFIKEEVDLEVSGTSRSEMKIKDENSGNCGLYDEHVKDIKDNNTEQRTIIAHKEIKIEVIDDYNENTGIYGMDVHHNDMGEATYKEIKSEIISDDYKENIGTHKRDVQHSNMDEGTLFDTKVEVEEDGNSNDQVGRYKESDTFRTCKVEEEESAGDNLSTSQVDFGKQSNMADIPHYHTRDADGTSLTSKCKLEKHNPTGDNSLKCSACGESFPNRRKFKIHQWTHSGEICLPFKCDGCDRSYIYKSELAQHMKTHFDKKFPFKCEICGKFFTRSSHVKKHKLMHRQETPFKCEVCGKFFTCQSDVIVHTRIHTGERPFKCETCGKSFKQQGHLVVHVLMHTGEKPFTCDICGKTFNVRTKLRKHSKIHSTKNSYNCNTCGKSFLQRVYLLTHKKRHMSCTEHRFKCEICGKTFRLACEERRHKMVHLQEKPHKCGLCEKSFAFPYELGTHTLLHTGEKPHKCHLCGKAYTIKHHLTRHIEAHNKLEQWVNPYETNTRNLQGDGSSSRPIMLENSHDGV